MISRIQQILTRYWGHSQFRPLQQDIILSVLDGHDTLALMPTGGGKSICFQVPALTKEGICIVISPLIALMKDQVERLKSQGIPAVAVVSGMSRKEIDITLDNCIHGKEKFLYISPERLSSDVFRARLPQMNVNLLAIDEAHCISQWGYDFRPSYLAIAEIRTLIPGVPVLALTATATADVQQDILEKLEFKNPNVFKKSFERKNLSYIVLHEEDKNGRLLKIAQNIAGTGIVYVRTRKKTREVAEFLAKNGIKAGYYNAGLSRDIRHRVQEDWMSNKLRIVVATNAFGMGIDKSEVRFVVHMDLPDNLEAYYQEAGRAGRDEKKSWAITLFNQSDRAEMEHRALVSFPEISVIRNTYQALGNYFQLPVGIGKGNSYPFDISNFCSTYELNMSEVFSSLKILELQGLLSLTETIEFYARVHFTMRSEHLYEFQVKNPRLDQFIKVLLRSYEGLFDEYVKINESEIALRAGMSRAEAIQQLELLVKLNVLDYKAASDTPQLVYLTERLDSRDLHIDRQHLSDRKQRYLVRAKAMMNYVETHHDCRSQVLLAYFGEDASRRCGVCDVCMQRNKIGLSDLEFNRIRASVQGILGDYPLLLNELVSKLGQNEEGELIKVIEWLIDNEEIRYTKGNKLAWNGD